MTTFTTLTNSDLDQDKPASKSKFRALRDNPVAIAEGDASAPKIANNALYAFTAGSVIQARSDAAATTTSGSFTKLKEIQVPRAGVLTVDFTLRSVAGSNAVLGRIYLNGSATGTQRSTTSSSGVAYSENITVAAGDLVQVYAQDPSTNTAEVSLFRLKAATHKDQFEVIL